MILLNITSVLRTNHDFGGRLLCSNLLNETMGSSKLSAQGSAALPLPADWMGGQDWALPLFPDLAHRNRDRLILIWAELQISAATSHKHTWAHRRSQNRRMQTAWRLEALDSGICPHWFSKREGYFQNMQFHIHVVSVRYLGSPALSQQHCANIWKAG